MSKRAGSETAENQTVRNLSVRNRRLPQQVKLPRRPIDYSAHGDPCRAEPPISVGQDPLLLRLKGGQR